MKLVLLKGLHEIGLAVSRVVGLALGVLREYHSMSIHKISEWHELVGREISLAKNCKALSAALNKVALTLGFEKSTCILSKISSFKTRGIYVVGGDGSEGSAASLSSRMICNGGVVSELVDDEGMFVWEEGQSCMEGIESEGDDKGEGAFGVACVVIPKFSVTGIVSLVRASERVCSEEYRFLSCSFKFVAMQAIYKAISLDCEVQANERASLSAKEVRVLRCVADGETSKQIAKTLYISVDTVNFHLKNIYKKLDVGNKAQAAAYAAIHGLI